MCLIVLASGHAVYGQQPCYTPYTLEQVIADLELEEEIIEVHVIIEFVRKYKVDFELTSNNHERLSEAGATPDLLAAIENNPYQELIITFPGDGDNVSREIYVYGCGRVFPNWHLWLFAHGEGLAVWWPQREEVRVEENGAWQHVVRVWRKRPCYDRSPASGSKFDIEARWVNEVVHQSLVDLFPCEDADGCCPGMLLPSGSASAQVTVRKLGQ